MMEEEKKCCSSCAFMMYEDVCGNGSCPFDPMKMTHCEMDACQNHIGRDKVRHSAAILAQSKRNVNTSAYDFNKIRKPKNIEIDEAIDIITRYVNVITKKV